MDKILVCLKQVPDTKEIKIDPENHTLIREGVESVLNIYDEYAIEEALKLKKKYGFKVGVFTMGPPQAVEILKYGISVGADEAFLLTDKRLVGSDTWATSLAIVSLIKKIKYTNIFCGQESLDSGTGHIGPGIAELLNIPQINYAKKIVKVKSEKIQVLSTFNDGDAVIEVNLPVVISFLRKNKKNILKKLREPNLKKIKQYSLDDINLDEKSVGLEGSFTQVINIDIDDRFIEYLIVDNNLKAEDRLKYILSGGIEEKKNRKIIKNISKKDLLEISKIIR